MVGPGLGARFAGGIVCLAAALFLFVHDAALFDLDRDTALHVRATFPFVAAWLVVFMLPMLWFTPDRKSEGLPKMEAVRQGFGQLHRTLGEVRRYPGLIRFVIARAIFMDGLATVFALGGVYAAGTFGMDGRRLLYFGIALNLSAGLGAWLFSGVDDRIGSRRTILITTSFAGPLLVGALTALTGNQRIALIVIPAFFLIGWLILKGVPPEQERTAS